MKFLKNVIAEMKQVTWLSGKKLTNLTWTVVSSIIIFAVLFGIIDAGLTVAIRALLAL